MSSAGATRVPWRVVEHGFDAFDLSYTGPWVGGWGEGGAVKAWRRGAKRENNLRCWERKDGMLQVIKKYMPIKLSEAAVEVMQGVGKAWLMCAGRLCSGAAGRPAGHWGLVEEDKAVFRRGGRAAA